jgi:putative addiction module component (TIGR02574 family)
MSDLRSQLANLSAAEKVELLDAVWESLESDAQLLSEAQRAELDSRLARHETSPSDGSLGKRQGRSIQKAMTLPVFWLPEAEAELGDARFMVRQRPI